MHIKTLKLGVLAAALTLGGTAFAQGSDSCMTPQVLPGDGSYAFDNTAATTGVDGQDCFGMYSDVWFEWTASVTGTGVFSTCGGTGLDTVITAYVSTGSCPAPGAPYVDCNDQFCGNQSEISFPVTSGTTYLLQLGSWSSGTTGTGTFSIVAIPPICSLPDDDLTTGDNDDCASALPLPLGFNTGFQVHGVLNGTGLDEDFWSVTILPNERLDLTASFDGSVGNINLVAWDVTGGCPGAYLDDSSLNPADSESLSINNLGAVAIDVVIQVEANGFGFDCNDYTMDAALVPALTNDDCLTPAATGPSGTYSFDNVTATTGTEGQDCTTINSDVWFEWTADFTGSAEFTTCGGTTLDTKIAAYVNSGCPATGIYLDCNDDVCGLQSSITFPVTNGVSYLLQIGSYSTTVQGTGTFGIGQILPCSNDTLEPNNDCASAVPLPQGLTTGLWVAGANDVGGEDADFYSVTVGDGETLTVDLYFLNADGDMDLFFYDSADPTCGGGFGVSAELAYGYTGTDNENATWTNSTGADVNVVVHVEIYDFSVSHCNTYDMEVSGGSSVLGTPFCFGDGSDGVVCPCGNVATAGSGEGCKHSTGVGSFLTAAGSPTVGADTLILTINQGEPNEACIFMSNNSLGAAPFLAFDGAICCGVDASLTRHFTNPATGAPIPTILDATGSGTNVMPLSLSDFNGLTVPGATMHYQAWMRSPTGPCASGAQFSAGISILWN